MRILRLFSPILIPLFLYGCGGGGNQQQPEAVSKQAASEECMNCHVDALSPGTSAHIVDEWRLSAHNLKDGAGCADCHEPAPGHPNVCDSCHAGGGTPTRDEVSRNPDAAGKCAKCHGVAFRNDVLMIKSPQHFGNMTASSGNTSYRPSYMASRYYGRCRNCHNPHDVTSGMPAARQWAQSPLGNTAASAFRSDHKTSGTTRPASAILGQSFCVRCHTTTGFINFVSPDANGQRFSDQHAWGVSSDKTKEVVGCDACHDNGKGSNYSYAVRYIPGVTIYFNYSAANSPVSLKMTGKATNYPDFGGSNVCVPCHVGRGSIGQVIKDIAALGVNFTNANQPAAGHNRVAASNLAQNSCYEFPGRNYSNPDHLHGSLGLGDLRGTGTSGPCVTCHMKNGPGHGFYPVTMSSTKVITAITTNTCLKCHDGAFKQAWDVDTLQAKKDGFAAALAILNLLRSYPSTATTAGALKNPTVAPKRNPNWDVFSPGNGANTMGVSFNYSEMSADPAAFVHNSRYAKRIIYDSIDWIYDGNLDDDVEAAINSATLPPNATTTSTATKGYVSLRNPITAVYYFQNANPADPVTIAAFAKVKIQAINYLMGASGGARP